MTCGYICSVLEMWKSFSFHADHEQDPRCPGTCAAVIDYETRPDETMEYGWTTAVLLEKIDGRRGEVEGRKWPGWTDPLKLWLVTWWLNY